MSTQSPLNAKESRQDSPLEAQATHNETDSLSIPSKDMPSDILQPSPPGSAQDAPPDGFPPLPSERMNESRLVDAKKGKVRKRKGKKGKRHKAGRSGNSVSNLSVQYSHADLSPCQSIQVHAITSPATGREPQGGEEGVSRTGADRIGLHSVPDKNVDQKEPCVETQPFEGVEDVLKEGMEEVQTRAELYREQRGIWEAQGDISVRVYARPLNPRLILVEWEGEDGVEKHGSLVVNPRHRGMFGPGKVVWVRGPLVGSRWVLAGKYNFLGNRVS